MNNKPETVDIMKDSASGEMYLTGWRDPKIHTHIESSRMHVVRYVQGIGSVCSEPECEMNNEHTNGIYR